MPPTIICLVDAKNRLGEGCMWDEQSQSLWWLDIPLPSRIHRLHLPTGEQKAWQFEVLLSCMALKPDGTVLVGGERGLHHFNPETGILTDFVQPENIAGNRGNDGAADAKGRFWFGTMQQNIGPRGEDFEITQSTGALYKVETSGVSTKMLAGVGVSNGPCWSPGNKTFYFSDSRAQVIYAFDFDLEHGTLHNQRIHNDTKDFGYPDGATVDAEGFLWSARWDGHCVLRIDPKGRIDRIVEMPASRPTCVCFGGPDMDQLFITSSRAHVDAATLARYPQQGGVFTFAASTKGFAKHRFGG
ncbi:MAG: SMP-30/gluconolactonase/LRE family protein [Alphaproteobacteria bacterium]|nr:SMP-30/gluconolactonase/LRE family protein [Alphaproteobacteria bacterium]